MCELLSYDYRYPKHQKGKYHDSDDVLVDSIWGRVTSSLL